MLDVQRKADRRVALGMQVRGLRRKVKADAEACPNSKPHLIEAHKY